MKIYLLLVNDEKSFFYSDESEPDRSQVEAQARGGWWDRLEERWHRFQTDWHESDAGVARWVHRTWDWLHSMAHPDESLLSRLRWTRRIDLHYPDSRSKDDVERIWQDYLARKWRRHILLLIGNAAVAPLALALLWPLPGPNLIGYWFAYRAIHHWLIVRGIGGARKGRIPTEYQSETSLNLPVRRDDAGKATHEAINGEGHLLDEYMSRTGPTTRETRPGDG